MLDDVTRIIEEADNMEAGQEAATRYIQQNRAPLFADNETSLSEKYGRDVAAAIIATHLANAATHPTQANANHDQNTADPNSTPQTRASTGRQAWTRTRRASSK